MPLIKSKTSRRGLSMTELTWRAVRFHTHLGDSHDALRTGLAAGALSASVTPPSTCCLPVGEVDDEHEGTTMRVMRSELEFPLR
jgi:hypothetical protein